MSQSKTTADLVNEVLRMSGELMSTEGTYASPYTSQAHEYLSQAHRTLVAGGNEFNVEFDEPWVWARARRPLLLELQPPYETGGVTLAQGSEVGTFSSAPSASLQDYFLRVTGQTSTEVYKIASHTAGATAFELDGAYAGSNVSAQAFSAFKLDYDLVTSYITIDSYNNKLDFLVNSSASALTATLTAGAYTPAQLATHVASALQTADSARAYSGSYDSIQRFFSFTSNLAANAVFQVLGANTNAYRSGWDTLGFDYSTSSNAATQTSVYGLSSVARLCQPARIFGDSRSEVAGLDPLAFERDYPLHYTEQKVPSHFCITEDDGKGKLRVRFNNYPDRKMRVEFDHIPMPKDLQNNSSSVPLLPRKYLQTLRYMAAFLVLTDKNDVKADKFFQLAQAGIQAMVKDNRQELRRIGVNFGSVIARPEKVGSQRLRNRLNYGYDKGSW